MTKEKLDLPKFVEKATIADLESVEETIFTIHNKLHNITKSVQTKNYSKPKHKSKVIGVATRIKTSIEAMALILNDFEDKITLESYFNTLNEIVSELEVLVISNSINFYNKKVLKHYQEVVNLLLIKTKAMNSINYCSERLSNEMKE